VRIAILGSGGVGGYFGARLAAAGAEVAFIARGAHLAALRERGFHIVSPDGDLHLPHVDATNDTAAVGPVDVVFFTVKLYDTDSAVAMLPPLLGPETIVVPFQNGVDAVGVLSQAVGARRVAGGTTYIVAGIEAPGVVRHTALGRLIFGPLDESQRPMLEALLDRCRRARVDAVLSDRITADIWAKFVRLTAFSGMTAVTRRPIGELQSDPELWTMTESAVCESLAVARARGIPLPDTAAAEIMAALRAMPPQSKSSMLGDLEQGRPLELPWLSGAIVRIGREVGVDTPTHRFIAAVLRPHATGTR
jgi:2-dehydropantoate 2-reductase